jgi:hypothetical protein
LTHFPAAANIELASPSAEIAAGMACAQGVC